MAGNLLKIIKIHNKEVNRKMSNEKIISGGGVDARMHPDCKRRRNYPDDFASYASIFA